MDGRKMIRGRFRDLTGKKFGKWTVIKRSGSDARYNATWFCECECGTIKEINSYNLNLGKSKSCGCERRKNRIGQRFGNLTVIERLDSGSWRCLCDCGNEKICPVLRKDRPPTSCGCARKGRGGPLHPRWKGGRNKTGDGYIQLWNPKHPNSDPYGRVLEHTVVMSEMIGRPLKDSEFVHHKNGIRDDNRPENLELWTKNHPHGVRVEDLLEFCRQYIEEYG